MADVEPDAILDDVWQWVDTRQPSRLEREERARDRGEFVALQPRLTGGGSIFGELGTVSFGIIAQSLSADAPPPTCRAGSHSSGTTSPDLAGGRMKVSAATGPLSQPPARTTPCRSGIALRCPVDVTPELQSLTAITGDGSQSSHCISHTVTFCDTVHSRVSHVTPVA